jgi:hypothetical protein
MYRAAKLLNVSLDLSDASKRKTSVAPKNVVAIFVGGLWKIKSNVGHPIHFATATSSSHDFANLSSRQQLSFRHIKPGLQRCTRTGSSIWIRS